MQDTLNPPTAQPVDLFAEMRSALRPKGTAPVVRLFMRDAACFNADFVQKAVDDAQMRCAAAAAGMDTLSPLEQLGLQLLLDSSHIVRKRV